MLITLFVDLKSDIHEIDVIVAQSTIVPIERIRKNTITSKLWRMQNCKGGGG